MTKALIIEKFDTSIGLAVKVKNDRIFRVGDKLEIDSEEWTIKGITFPSRPTDEEDYVMLIICKE